MSITTDKVWTLDGIKARNAAEGLHWFEPATMRFFRSRVSGRIFQGPGGVYFVSSEARRAEDVRMFTVRRFDPTDGSVDTLGDFQGYAHRHEAAAVAKRAACGDGVS